MLTGITAATLSLTMLATAALGQYSGGVNVDFNVAAGAGAGQPTILFGGAIGQAGYWNPINAPYTNGTTVPLRDPANSINAVNMMYSWGGAAGRNAFSFNNASTTGDAELLLDDVLDLGGPGNGAHTFAVGPFAAGLYRVVTYAVTPDLAGSRTDVTVNTAQEGGTQTFGDLQTVGGAIPAGGVFTPGITHAQQDNPLYSNGTIYIDASTSSGFGSINGFQIQRLAPTRLYVRRGALSLGAGLSWAAPLESVQAALAFARITPSVTEIWVARGTFLTDEFPENTGNAAAAFALRSNLAVYGGFAGTEATLAERDLNNPANETILSGQGLADFGVYCDGATGVTLDGLTVTGCKTGVTLTSSSTATLNRVVLRDNGGPTSIYAALNAELSSSATLRGCAVYNNAGLGSGGIFHLFLGGSLDVADTLIVNNTVQLNLMDAGTGGSTTFRNCTIAHNASAGGGDRVSLYFAPSTQIRNCIFWNNTDGGIPAGESGFHTLLLNVDWGTSSVTDNIIQGWSGTLAPTFDANSGADPRFVAAVAPGVGGAPVSPSWYTLQSRSPARDSGWNAGVAGSVDFFGNTRIVDDPYFPNTGFAGGTVDRGCFEMQSPSVICPGDLGSQGGVVGADGVRDNNDFVVFIDLFFLHDPRADLGRQGGIPGADGQYDNNDFVVFIDAFFTLCP